MGCGCLVFRVFYSVLNFCIKRDSLGWEGSSVFCNVEDEVGWSLCRVCEFWGGWSGKKYLKFWDWWG